MMLVTGFLSIILFKNQQKIITSFWGFFGTNNSWTVKINVEIKKVEW